LFLIDGNTKTQFEVGCAVIMSFLQEKFEDTKGVTRSRKWKKDRQYNNQKKKDKRSNNVI